MCVLAGNRKSMFYAIAASLSLIAGCQAAESEKQMVEFKKNPAPKKAYQIKAKIANAPGLFAVVKGFMQYDVANQECTPPPKTQPGGVNAPVPTDDIPFEVTKVSDTEYVGTIYTDGMVDEDYYGYGVCRWKLTAASMLFQATGAKDETTFQASLFSEELTARKVKKIYFMKRWYPRDQITPDVQLENFVDSGMTDRSKMNPELTDDDLFTIDISSMEMAQ